MQKLKPVGVNERKIFMDAPRALLSWVFLWPPFIVLAGKMKLPKKQGRSCSLRGNGAERLIELIKRKYHLE